MRKVRSAADGHPWVVGGVREALLTMFFGRKQQAQLDRMEGMLRQILEVLTGSAAKAIAEDTQKLKDSAINLQQVIDKENK